MGGLLRDEDPKIVNEKDSHEFEPRKRTRNRANPTKHSSLRIKTTPEKDHCMPACPNCGDENRVTDPATGETFCQNCGLLLPEGAVPIGARDVLPVGFMRRLRVACKEIERDSLQHQQKLHVSAARVLDVHCAWQGCQAAPVLHSKWCPIHRKENGRKLTRERVRRYRKKVSPPKISACNALQPPTIEEECLL
jgi:ribosomal protein S27E